MSSKQLFLTGQSYAGKYLPVYAHTILEENKQFKNYFKIPLAGILISGPFPSPLIERVEMHNVGLALNMVDESNLGQIAVLEQHCSEEVGLNLTKANAVCESIMGYISQMSGSRSSYDARIFNYDSAP